MQSSISRCSLASLLLLGSFLAFRAPAAEPEPGFVPMFNGKDLTGWEGRPGWWRVEDGCITSESTKEKPCDRAHYLMWRGGKPGDFELRADFRLQGQAANSGIQFRSREVPEWDTSGYQADMENGDQWTGCLFEHTRGGVAMRGEKVIIDKDGKKTIRPLALQNSTTATTTGNGTVLSPGAQLLKYIRKGEWNSYTIIAKGAEVTLLINGKVMTQVTDNQEGIAARDGIIALQMHPGPPMRVQFKNLRIKMLDSAK